MEHIGRCFMSLPFKSYRVKAYFYLSHQLGDCLHSVKVFHMISCSRNKMIRSTKGFFFIFCRGTQIWMLNAWMLKRKPFSSTPKLGSE